jgi:hypothetical protein
LLILKKESSALKTMRVKNKRLLHQGDIFFRRKKEGKRF